MGKRFTADFVDPKTDIRYPMTYTGSDAHDEGVVQINTPRILETPNIVNFLSQEPPLVLSYWNMMTQWNGYKNIQAILCQKRNNSNSYPIIPAMNATVMWMTK